MEGDSDAAVDEWELWVENYAENHDEDSDSDTQETIPYEDYGGLAGLADSTEDEGENQPLEASTGGDSDSVGSIPYEDYAGLAGPADFTDSEDERQVLEPSMYRDNAAQPPASSNEDHTYARTPTRSAYDHDYV